MTVKEWMKENEQKLNGTVRIYNTWTGLYAPIYLCKNMEVLKVRQHNGWGYGQINTVLEV